MNRGGEQPRVGVACIITKVDQKGVKWILVGKRKSTHGAGALQLPGGHLEYGESWKECAAREVLEETGYFLDEKQQISFFTVTNDVFSNDKLHYITIFMMAELTPEQKNQEELPKVLEPEKCAWWKWVSKEEFGRLDKQENPIFLPVQHLIERVRLPADDPNYLEI